MTGYLISDPAFYTSRPGTLSFRLSRALRLHRPGFACYRDKSGHGSLEAARTFVETVRRFHGVKAMVNGSIGWALASGADGVHLTSRQHHLVRDARKKGLIVIASCHTEEEIGKCARAGAFAATFSPVFPSPGKGPVRGIGELKRLVDTMPLNIIGLGGITTPAQVGEVRAAGAFGFASIRYFTTNHHKGTDGI